MSFNTVIGTSFDPAFIDVAATGSMGDVIGVNLSELAAKQLLLKEKKISESEAKIALQNMDMRLRALVTQRMAKLGDFSIQSYDLDRLADSGGANGTSLKLITRTSLSKDPYSRLGEFSTEEASFKTSGVLFFAPVLTDQGTSSDLERLRSGNVLHDKEASFYFTCKDSSSPEGSEVVGRAVVTAKDFATVSNAFFGDRPLDNPGYSVFGYDTSFKGDVVAGQENDRLDVYRIEQRLKYLGYPAYDLSKLLEFSVDGTFGDEERRALQLFEKIVRYGTGATTGEGEATGNSKNPWAVGVVKVKVTYNGIDGTYSPPTVISETCELRPAGKKLEDLARKATIETTLSVAKANAIEVAMKNAKADYDKQIAETKQFDPARFGADGILLNDAEGRKTLDWLNAYNAPHWMHFGGKQLEEGWKDERSDKAAGMSSWVYDLMLLSQNAAKAQGRPERLWYKGSGELGNMLNLGINTKFVSEKYQKSIYSDEWLIGLASTNSVDLTGVTASNASGATAEQKLKFLLQEKERLQSLGDGKWDAEKAGQLADLLQYINRTQPAATLSNNQADALKDFLAVYSATQNDGVSGNGSLDEQLNNIRSGKSDSEKMKIIQSLFGDGNSEKGLIDRNGLVLGGVGAKNVGMGAQLTDESLAVIMGTSASRVVDWVSPLNQALAKFDINTAKRISAFLVNARFEAFFDEDLVENRSDASAEAAYGNRPSYGNSNPGDGAKYKGRGLLQITFKYGYEILGQGGYRGWTHKRTPPYKPESQKVPGLNELLGTTYDFVQDPGAMVSDKYIAALSGGWYWRFGAPPIDGDLNKIIDRAGTPAEDNFENAIMGIKGHGNSEKDQKNRQDRIDYWNSINNAFVSHQNSYGNMQSMLTLIGFTTKNKMDYNTKFGIGLGPHQRVSIEEVRRLEALSVSTDHVYSQMATEIIDTDFGLQAGERDMLIPDQVIQDQSQLQPMVILAKATSKEPLAIPKIGICVISPTSEQIQALEERHSIKKLINPRMDAENHFAPPDNKWFGFTPEFTDEQNISTVKILLAPKHGKLSAYKGMLGDDFAANSSVSYIPNPGYVGKDRMTFMVTGNKGHVIIISYYVDVTPAAETYGLYRTDGYKKYCPNGRLIWKISQPSMDDGSETSSWVDSSLHALLGNAKIAVTSFTNLPGTTIGQTIGSGQNAQLILDSNAAGHGWFIDATPADNVEFLPTSNPNEWVARPGSEAEGRIDLLTVLLHEYGHTLGLAHSADAHDYMAATLPPGVRRTLSVDEQLALLQLAGHFPAPESPTLPYAPSDPGVPLPFTRVTGLNRSARLRGSEEFAAAGNAWVQYDIAANPTLENPTFDNGTGWSTTGDVSFADGSAILAESPSTQTRLNQVFVLGKNDRFLSFTVAAALGDQADGPDDAFEVALIDANRGVSVLGSTRLSHGDAIINRQADGSEYRADAISVLNNPDGSRSYQVDLGGVAAGTVLNLAFDLIGFGKGADAGGSRVSIRDLHLSSEPAKPEAIDDAVITDEDHPLLIDALANDRNARQPGFAPVVVDGPAHGELVVNADASFHYTPAKDWHGEDRFTYQLSDGQIGSGVATVTLTVTPVNDAPLVSPLTGTLLEDGSVTLDLLSGATDPDGDALAVSAGSPRHGTLSSNGDGSYTYRPAIDYHGEDELAFTISDGQVATEGTLRLTISAQADAPTLTLTDGAGTTREIYRSGWESVANAGATPTPVKGDGLEGWQRLSGEPSMPGGSFQIWSGGDRMRNALGGSLSAYPAAGSGQNWLELNIVGSTPIPTRAIERGIDTIAGATYTLSLTLAGAPGYAAEYTRIGITLDGRNIGSEASTSPLDALAWQKRTFQFVGAGGRQTLRIASEATRFDAWSSGTMIDDIVLSETLPANVGYEDAPIQLPTIAATLRDDDGSEALSIDIAGLPVGATLSDGEHHFTASRLAQRLTISDWDLGKLSITPPPDRTGRFTLTIVATATEQSNGSQASTTASFEVLVLPVDDAPTWTSAPPASFELQAGMAAAGMRLQPSTTSPGASAALMTQPFTAMPTVNDIGPARPDAPGARLDMPPQVFRYQATARDADGDALSYRLLDGPAGARIDAASGLLLWESPQAGEQFFRLEADDGKGNRVEQRFTVQFGSAQRTGTSGKPPARPHPASVTTNSSRANEQSPRKPGPQNTAPSRIDWSGAQPACFAGPRLTPSPWLPEFLGAAGRAQSTDRAALQIRITP
jgi:predicted chitinase